MQKKNTKDAPAKPRRAGKKEVKPLVPCDEVYRTDSDLKSMWVILSISPEEETATIFLKGTELQRFPYPLDKLVRV